MFRDYDMSESQDIFAAYSKSARLLARAGCAALWAVVAFVIQDWTLFFLDGFYPGYVEPNAYDHKSANTVGGWFFVSIPVVLGFSLGWWLKDYVPRIWIAFCAAGQIVLSMNYILWYDENYWHPGRMVFL